MKTYKLYPIYKKSVVEHEEAYVNGKCYAAESTYRWAEFHVDLPIEGAATLADQEHIGDLESYLDKLGGENFEITELIDECSRFEDIDGEIVEEDEVFENGLWEQPDYESHINIQCALKLEAV